MKSRAVPSRRRLPARAAAASFSPATFECLERRVFLDGDPSGNVDLSNLLGDVGGVIDALLGGPTENQARDDDDDDDDSRGGGRRNDAAPTAQLAAGDLTAASDAPLTVSIVYTDDKKVRAKTIDKNDIAVVGPDGPNLTITGVTLDPDKDNNTITATYTVAAPGGGWDEADNGAYTVTLKPFEVFDTRFQSVDAVSKTFQVNVPAPAADTTGPAAVIAVQNITSPGEDTHDVTVTYTDDAGINPRSIGPRDLTVLDPEGKRRPIRSVSLNTSDDGKQIIATYTVDAPDKVWDSGDNGAYTITLNPDEVRDTSDNAATATAAVSFTVNCPPPEPVDSGFGGGGGGSGISAPFVAEAVVAQPDGKLLVVGRQGDLGKKTSQAVLARYNADGTADSTFGTRGRATTSSGGNDAYYAVALSADGKILVAGTRGGDVLLSRFDSAGKLDATFANAGNAMADFGGANDAANALGIAPDGAVIVAGGADGNFAVARFQAGGALDPNFGQGGKQLFDLGSSDDTPGAVAFQGDKPVIVGTSGGKVAVVRMRADGEADPTFSGDGLLLLDALAARTDANFADRSTAAAVQPDGKLLLANRSASGDFAVARLNVNGAFDTSFGNAGLATIDFGGDDDADAVLVQESGEILAIGTTDAGGTPNTAVAALDSSGKLIGDFGTSGKLTLSPDLAPQARALRVGDLVLRAFGTRQPDGRLVVGTANANGGNGGGTEAPNNPVPSSSSLRRLNVPGTRSQPQGTLIGTFGSIDGAKRTTLTYTENDGTKVTFAASRGSGTAYVSGGRINLVLSDAGGGTAVAIKSTGGDDNGRVQLGDIVVSGAVRFLSGRSADLAGTLFASGSIGKVTLGALTGTIAAAGTIGSISLASMTGARIMSAAGLGADGKLGGEGADADTFAAGSIASVRVSGAIESSTISAGLDPVDGVFNNNDDRVIGGVASVIRSVSARNADETSRFIAGTIGSLRLPGKVDLSTDSRVKLFV